MQDSDIPLKFPIPWGASAGASYIRSIPTASQIGVEDGAASLTDGFVPLNSTPLGAGGIPPSIKDMNGALFRVTGWARWVAAGGPVFYDSDFASAVGGYPKSAVLASATTAGLFWVSLVENNVTNPDGGGASGWTAMSPVAASSAEVAAGSVSTKFVTPASLADQRATGTEAVALSSGSKLVTPAALASLRAVLSEVLTGTDNAKWITSAVLAGLRASGAEVQAGTNDAKYVTPASLAAAFDASADHIRIGPVLVQWGQYRFTTNQVGLVFTTAFPHAFGGAPYAIVLQRYDPGGGTYNQKHYQRRNADANGFEWFLQDNDSGNSSNYGYGFDWIAVGPA